jgi:nitronate monooxygenase
VPAVVDLVAAAAREVSVVAAGGIGDGRGLAAALMLGADGVLMGSRFYAAEESLAPTAGKARIIAGSGDDTLRTHVFDIVRECDWPKEYTGRALRNRFSETSHGREAALAEAAASENPRYAAAAAVGDVDIGVVFTGRHRPDPCGRARRHHSRSRHPRGRSGTEPAI